MRPGGVTVSEYDAGADRWTRLAQGWTAEVVLDRSVPFRVRVARTAAGSALRVDIGGQRAITLDVPRHLDGAWGLGAQANAAGVWSGVDYLRSTLCSSTWYTSVAPAPMLRGARSP
jgi:hypothetical protein